MGAVPPGLAAPLFVIACVCPELFTSPAPSRASTFPFVLIVKALAPSWKLMDSTVTSAERVSDVCVEALKVAVSPGLTGAAGAVDQLVPAFQLPDSGLSSQTASTASTGVAVATESDSATSHARIEAARVPERFLGGCG